MSEIKWVDLPVRAIGAELRYAIYGRSYPISTAVNNSEFVGYVYADGLVTPAPRRDDFDCGIAMAPVAVRFWTGGAQ